MTLTFSVEKPDKVLSLDLENVPQSTLDRSLPIYLCLVSNSHRLLDRFAEYKVKTTFFVLGLVTETYSDLLQDIAAPDHLSLWIKNE